MSDGSGRSALGVLASCVVHAAMVLGVHSQGSAREQTLPTPLWMELQIERREPEPDPDTTPLPIDSMDVRAPAPITEAHSVAVPRVSRTSRPAAPTQPEQPAPREEAPSAAPSETPTVARSATIDLSPLAAARTLGDSTYFPSRDAGASTPEQPPRSHTATANALATQVAGLRASRGSERSMEGAIVDGTEDAIYHVLRPWKLLHKTMQGSQYRYTGAGFDAAILPDGRVRFRDKDGPALSVIVIKPPESGPAAQVPPATTFGLSLGDLRSLFTRIRGKDPHAAERRTFLERTRALREYLSGRAPQPETTEPAESRDELDSEPQLEPADGPR